MSDYVHSNRIGVYARIRPALPREISLGNFTRCLGVPRHQPNSIIVTKNDQPVLLNNSGDIDNHPNLQKFEFDGVIQEESTNDEVFKEVCTPLIDGLFKGINGCLLSYGQTGSGKTHTMLGTESIPSKFPPLVGNTTINSLKDRGLILLTANKLLNESSLNGHSKISVSYLQIYGKEITDLLGHSHVNISDDENLIGPPQQQHQQQNNNSNNNITSNRRERSSIKPSSLTLRDYGDEINVEGLARWEFDSMENFELLLKIGNEKRVVANTKLNSTSSRSHAVVTFYYESSSFDEISNNKSSSSQNTVVTAAKFHMVDLAGSERVKDSGVEGKSLKEACQINLSLFHLARVVKSIDKASTTSSAKFSSTNALGSMVIPYKDDVLTHLLKDSLCGSHHMKSRTCLLAMISPSQLHAYETSSTLSFAMGCSRIKMKSVLTHGQESNSLKPWQSQGEGVLSLAMLKKREAKEEAKNAKLLPWAGIDPHVQTKHCMGGRIRLSIDGMKQYSSVSTLIYYSPSYLNALSTSTSDNTSPSSTTSYSKVAVLMHGYPSHAAVCFDGWLIGALCYCGFVVLAIDMPGCGGNQPHAGSSTLDSCEPFKSTRSEFALDKDGPADLVVACVNALSKFDFSRLDKVGDYDPNGDIDGREGRGGGSSCQSPSQQKYPSIGMWGESKAVLIGNDWGGGIAMMMGGSRRHKTGISHIVAHLPSFQEKKIAEMIKTPTLVLWSKDDQFHSLTSFLPISNILKKSLNHLKENSNGGSNVNKTSNVKKNSNIVLDSGIKIFGNYQEYIVNKKTDPKWFISGKERCILRFLTGQEYLPEAQTIHSKLMKESFSTQGKKINSNLNIIFRPSSSSSSSTSNVFCQKERKEEEDKMRMHRDFEYQLLSSSNLMSDEQNAVRGFKLLFHENLLDNILISLAMGGSGSSSLTGKVVINPTDKSIHHEVEEARKIFLHLPTLNPNTITPSYLLQCGLWSSKAEQAASMLVYKSSLFPRYFSGRTSILTPTGEIAELVKFDNLNNNVEIQSLNKGKNDFDDNDDYDDDDELRNSDRKSMIIPLTDFLQMNQRHIFPSASSSSSSSKLIFEDGITCNYANALTKAKLCQIALTLNPLFEKISLLFHEGYLTDSIEIERCRHQAIHLIRSCLNLTTFQRSTSSSSSSGATFGTTHSRNRNRYCKDDAGKFACFGEGHCHTVSSIMTAFLLPFCESCLGIDLNYREDIGGHHQWLEYTLLGSQMKKFTCDLYRQDGYDIQNNLWNVKREKRFSTGFQRRFDPENKVEHGGMMQQNKFLSLSMKESYPSWPLPSSSSFLRPSPVLKVLTGKAIRSAPLECGDIQLIAS